MSKEYTPPPKSYKRAYPFKLGTTSFIYPDSYISNMRMLEPCLDEIELLFLESAEAGLPSEREIEALCLLAEESDMTCNVHLPMDVPLTDSDFSARRDAAKAIRNVIDLTAPLSPSTYTLHLHYDEASREEAVIKKWQQIAYESTDRLLSDSLVKPELFSIETLDYPFEWVEKIIRDFHVSVCMDLGHLILYGFDAEALFDQYAEIISIIHLHGVRDGRDHIPLDRLSDGNVRLVMDILRRFTGVVSLEVFSYEYLIPSLIFLEKCWQACEKDCQT
ncbi:MAG: hypothetical protein B6245_19890 [Desulfobacteraceae bacterium 4572_88]|nr:MAG: hypothetical protein B6245_19890 [Desulfobacteraceae bacterium 4572_88]